MNRADEMLDAQVEAMQREMARVANPGEELNYELRSDFEKPKSVDGRKKVERNIKSRGSRGFVRFLFAICLGVVGTLAWQAYGDAAKQIIATRAPEYGWSPESKQMIAKSIQWLGWAEAPGRPKTTAAETVAPKTPTVLDQAQLQQIAQSVAVVRQTVEQLATRQEQIARETARLESAVAELGFKKPELPAQSPAAPKGKLTPVPPSSREPTSPQTLRTH